ncbi:MAG: acetolactate synthase-1/2/3 large subunit [Cellvibrionaceae bacterium]|jgi:acetolactate synthase-1/2/3 large subunit
MQASDLFVKCLEEESIKYIFGVPGEENADFMMSLEKSNKIRFILTRHEQGAAFMAEIYGRLTGNPAGCLGTLGPGSTNLITGVANSNMDHAPMLVLTGQAASTRLHKESHQVMDVVEMFSAVTKWATTIWHPENIPEIVRKAVRLARTEKLGATHIELPEDIAKLPIEKQPLKVHKFLRPVPNPEAIDLAYDRIKKAERPVIIAGNGCIRSRASEELRILCEKTGIGVMSTFMAKGCVDMDAPYCLYTIGLGAKDIPAIALDSSDLIITLGYDMVEYHPKNWNDGGKTEVLHIDFLPAEIDSNYHPIIEVVGDLAHALEMLNHKIDVEGGFEHDFSVQHYAREQMSKELAGHKDDSGEGPIRPQKAIWDARQVLGDDDILLSDVGAHKMWIARHYHCHQPNTCLIPNGFCSMGFALPGAIAANLVYPDRRILAICGDGGFLMNVQEMETASRLKSNITVMVWEDGGYGLISWKQENEFDRSTDLAFTNPDWLKLADAFGWNGYLVTEAQKLQSALEQTFQETGPSLLVIPIDYNENKLLTQQLRELTANV